MTRVHAYLLSDLPGAAYAFAATIMGGTALGIALFVAVLVTVVEAL